MTDILAPDVVAPFLSSSSTEDAKFQLSTYRGKWVMLLFVRQGQESKIGDFLRQVQLWVNEVEPEWKSYNCHVTVFASSKDVDAELQQLSAVTFVLDEDRSVASSFHCNEENATSNDVATVLIDTEGYIRYTVKNDMAADMKVASNLRVLRALARDGASDDAEEKAQEDVDEAEPAVSSSFLSWARTSQSAAAQKSSDLVTEASNLLSYYQWQLRQRPLMTKAITSAIISAAGEALGSWLKGSKQSFVQTLRRIGVFFVYGLCIAGPFFHWWYGVLDQYTRALGLPRILTFIIQLALNQLVMTPAMLVVTLAFLQLTHTTSLQSILRNVKNAFAGALYTNWRVWTVAQAINFQVVPLDYRVLFGNVVALWWNIVLSWTTSAPVADN